VFCRRGYGRHYGTGREGVDFGGFGGSVGGDRQAVGGRLLAVGCRSETGSLAAGDSGSPRRRGGHGGGWEMMTATAVKNDVPSLGVVGREGFAE